MNNDKRHLPSILIIVFAGTAFLAGCDDIEGADESDVGFRSGVAGPVAAGGAHTCAVIDDGTLKCWGANNGGQLGDGTLIDRPTAVSVEGLADVVTVDGGHGRTCAVTATGAAYCWGAVEDLTPTPVDGLVDAVDIAVGYLHACAVRANGLVVCWGEDNLHGQLGDGTTVDKDWLVTVSTIGEAVAVDSGSYYSCALLSTGQVMCWGDSTYGAVGNGSEGVIVPAPVIVTGISNAIAIDTGHSHACAILDDGTVMCWGQNTSGQLGTGDYVRALIPVPLPGLDDVTEISTGMSHTCAIRSTGSTTTETYCWGLNGSGQLGIGSTFPSYLPVPTPVLSLTDATQVAAGSYSSCATHDDGSARCWGNNAVGQLGNGGGPQTALPVAVIGL